MGDIYRDLDQEHLARVAIEYAWRDLRRQPVLEAPDPVAINEACDRVELLIESLDTRGVTLRELQGTQLALERRIGTLAGETLQAAVLESNGLVFQLARFQAEVAGLRERLAQAQSDLECALREEVALPIISVDQHRNDLEAARLRAQDALAASPVGRGAIRVKEMAAVLDTSVKTINTWIRVGFPARRRVLWESADWTVDAHGVRVMPLRALKREELTPIERERLYLIELRCKSDPWATEAA